MVQQLTAEGVVNTAGTGKQDKDLPGVGVCQWW
jgi:hypothetical protein